MSSKDKWVRRFSVDETAKHEKGFTIYKITSVLFPISSPEAVTSVSVWKRFSDARSLHRSLKALHAGLHLGGVFPELPKWGYFRRFDQKVIDERAATIKTLLEFIAEHRLLFTSADFVNFLQTGYPAPMGSQGSVGASRGSLQLPLAGSPDAEGLPCAPSDDSGSPPGDPTQDVIDGTNTLNESIPQIPIYEAADVETRKSPINSSYHKNSSSNHNLSQTNHGSLDSLNSLESINSDLYDSVSKISLEKPKTVQKSNLPDLINFDLPSTSVLRTDSETQSISSMDSKRSISRLSMNKSLSLSDVDFKTRTENSYVFEAGYMLNLAARCEDIGDYAKAFDYYKCGIEKMLIGVKTDTDPQRRALIKEKTNKYLSYAEDIFRKHLSNFEQTESFPALQPPLRPTPVSRPNSYLGQFRALAALGRGLILALHKESQNCCAIKVIRKIPNNLTEFDDHFHRTTNETKIPILPINVPYMVPLQSYVETDNLIFLILSYAPGEKLTNYIKNYVNSNTNTPKRHLNLENVFSEPHRNDEVIKSDVNVNTNDGNVIIKDQNVITSDENDKTDDEIKKLVVNSQKLLHDVDKALKLNREMKSDKTDNQSDINCNSGVKKSPLRVKRLSGRAAVPPSALRRWASQVVVALSSLHDAGVICRDLNPENILLSDGGQITLTYFVGYPGVEMNIYTLQKRAKPGAVDLYVAPELYYNTILDESARNGELLERACDFWSFGAIMYELICGYPLSRYHRGGFTSHTLLKLPEGLDCETHSLLTQLLTFDPSERLGAKGIEEIKRHPYFKHIDWNAVREEWIVPNSIK